MLKKPDFNNEPKMTRKEFDEIAHILNAVYKKDNILANEYEIDAWYQFLKDFHVRDVRKAVKAWVNEKVKSPTIAELSQYIYAERNTRHEEELEAYERQLAQPGHRFDMMEDSDRKQLAENGCIDIQNDSIDYHKADEVGLLHILRKYRF